MSIAGALYTGAEAISLAEEIVRFINETKASGDEPTLNQLRMRLPSLATRNCENIKSYIDQLRNDLIRDKLFDKTIIEAEKSERVWTFLFRNTISQYRISMENIKNALNGLLDDMSAVLICAGANNRDSIGAVTQARTSLQSIFADAVARRKELAGIIQTNKKLSDILQELENATQRIMDSISSFGSTP